MGVTPKVVAPNIIEKIGSKESPTLYIKRLSLEKAQAVAANYANDFIVAADTIVLKGAKILEKPANVEEAHKMLTTLKGGRHNVLTAFTVASPGAGRKFITKVVKTSVLVKNLSAQEIQWFLNSGQWEGKSGGYAIQGLFEVFVKQVNGSISNVIGLPMMQVYNTLVGLGFQFPYDSRK